MPYNIALLDDHQVVLKSFANLLATSGCFRVAGMACDRPSLLHVLDQAQVDQWAVDVLVTDLLMPAVNGADLIPTVKAAYPDLRVLVLSGSGDSAGDAGRGRWLRD